MDSNQRVQLYEAVEEALDLIECDIGAAECHGILCGMLCSPEHFDPALWIRHTTGQDDVRVVSTEDSDHALWVLLRETLNGVNGEDLSLVMMLPDDDEPLMERTAALGAWCRGFLSGFGLTGPANLGQLSSDTRGFLSDLREIGRVDDAHALGEADERALFEVIEYVRVGALLVREETRFVPTGADPSEIVH